MLKPVFQTRLICGHFDADVYIYYVDSNYLACLVAQCKQCAHRMTHVFQAGLYLNKATISVRNGIVTVFDETEELIQELIDFVMPDPLEAIFELEQLMKLKEALARG